MNVFAIGSSKNIGYFATIRLLNKGATVTYLLRNTSVFDADETIQPFVRSGKARLVKGDALILEDVARGWAEAQAASDSQHVDTLLFSVGAAPDRFDLHGAHITPANLCSAALLNVLRTLPSNQRSPASQPKMVIITSTGITKASHNGLPFAIKLLYNAILTPPHVDKFGMERVLAHCMGTPFEAEAYRPDLLPQDWRGLEGVPEQGALKKILVVRPAWLTDGPAKADEPLKKGGPYKVRKGDKASLGWTISRKDVAHFIVEGGLAQWNEWEGQVASIFY